MTTTFLLQPTDDLTYFDKVIAQIIFSLKDIYTLDIFNFSHLINAHNG